MTVITRGGQRYTGVVELRNASKHVNRELDNEKRDDTTLEILLDEEVSSREDVERLGIAVGDIVCLDPRARRDRKAASSAAAFWTTSSAPACC